MILKWLHIRACICECECVGEAFSRARLIKYNIEMKTEIIKINYTIPLVYGENRSKFFWLLFIVVQMNRFVPRYCSSLAVAKAPLETGNGLDRSWYELSQKQLEYRIIMLNVCQAI